MAKKPVVYAVVGMRGTIKEMCRYEDGTFEVIEVVKSHPLFGEDADVIHARVTSPARNDARWRSFGFVFDGNTQRGLSS